MSEHPFSVHPFADTFPLMSGVDFAELAEDIEKNGLREPILLNHDGSVLIDGRNRLAACKAVEIEPRFDRLPEMTETQTLDLIVSKNLARRHLTPTEKAIIALELEERYASATKLGRPPKREGKSGPESGVSPEPEDRTERESAARAARAVGVSPASVKRAKRIKNEDPELFEEMKAGNVKVTQAAKQVAQRAAEKKAKAVEEQPKPKARTQRKPTVDIVNNAMRTLDVLADEIPKLDLDDDSIPAEQFAAWEKQLSGHMRNFRAFHKALKEKVASNA